MHLYNLPLHVKKNYLDLPVPLFCLAIYWSGQIIILHQPRFPWNKGVSLPYIPFGVRLGEVAINLTRVVDHDVVSSSRSHFSHGVSSSHSQNLHLQGTFLSERLQVVWTKEFSRAIIHENLRFVVPQLSVAMIRMNWGTFCMVTV